MCHVTAEPCRVLYDTDFFPNYLKCDEKVFPCKNCSNDVREMKFTTISSQCISPLVATDSVINYYPGKNLNGESLLIIETFKIELQHVIFPVFPYNSCCSKQYAYVLDMHAGYLIYKILCCLATACVHIYSFNATFTHMRTSIETCGSARCR